MVHLAALPFVARASRARPFAVRLALSLLVTTLLTLLPGSAGAQIKRPGAHPRYSVEIEPHLVLQWEHEPWDDAGIGPGVRFNIPFLDNGPIDRINNNMAIGFGVDWAHFGGDCDGPFGFGLPGDRYDIDCTGNTIMAPVTVQWNFFLTPRIAVFGEPGLAIAHQTAEASWRYPCPTGVCEYDVDDSDTEVWFVFWGGARFMLTDSIGFTARVGTPYVSLGASFLM
jgi:hypothetical protein